MERAGLRRRSQTQQDCQSGSRTEKHQSDFIPWGYDYIGETQSVNVMTMQSSHRFVCLVVNSPQGCASSAPPGQSRAGASCSTGCARGARAPPVATPLRPVGAKTRTIGFDLSRLPRQRVPRTAYQGLAPPPSGPADGVSKPQAATVAVVTSDHCPFSPRVLTHPISAWSAYA